MNKSKKKPKLFLNRAVSMNEQLTAINSSFSHPINEEDEYQDDNPDKKQVKREMGIFEQFKIKYDQLRKQNQQKRNQIDELKRANKRLEIQLLNINTEFYDKEIKRLRGQVDKFQEQAEDFKFKYFQSENKRKQLQSTLNVTKTQMAKIIKQFETEKVHNAELKHQIKEKEKQYLHIIATVQDSANKSVQRFTECEGKLNLAESELRKAKQQLEAERKNGEKLEKSKKQLQAEHKKSVQKYQIQLKTSKNNFDESEQQCRQYRKQITTLKQKLSELTLQLNKTKSLSEFQTTKNFEKVTQFRSTRLLEIQNKRLKEENQTIKKSLDNKTDCLDTAQLKLNEAKQQLELQSKEYEQKLVDLNNKKIAIQKHYESKNMTLSKELQLLKVKCIRWESEEENKLHQIKISKMTHSQQSLPMFQRQHNNTTQNPLIAFQSSFQQILNGKDSEIMGLKKSLSEKIQQAYKLKQDLQETNIQNEKLSSQIAILEKKLAAKEKNISSQQQIRFLEMSNQIQLLKKRLEQAEYKLEIKAKEIKNKDTFIVDSVIGRVQKQQQVPLILGEMQRILEAGYVQKLAEAEHKIKNLEQTQAKTFPTK